MIFSQIDLDKRCPKRRLFFDTYRLITSLSSFNALIRPLLRAAGAHWLFRKLLTAPAADSETITTVPLTGAVWKLVTQGDYMLILVRQAIFGP